MHGEGEGGLWVEARKTRAGKHPAPCQNKQNKCEGQRGWEGERSRSKGKGERKVERYRKKGKRPI